ncbi:MAG: glycosyltransferase family 4 protein [Thiobacillaceae bacterium]
MRIGFDRSIRAFNAAGNARYTTYLEAALARIAPGEFELVPLDLPCGLRAVWAGPRRTALVAFWELLYAPLLLPRLARAARVDLLHCPLPMPVGDPGCPRVVTVHDTIPALFPQWFPPIMGTRLRRWLRRGVGAADALITDSHHTAADVHRLFPGLTAPVYPIPLGSFLEGTQAQVSAGPTYILSVGTLEPRKNLARVLEAYALLARARPELPRLVVVGGPGWGDTSLADLARVLGVAGQVDLAGFVPDDALPNLYAGAALLVYPSLYEGFGFPVLEAMSMGCPVVTSNRSSLPEIAGDAAICVDPDTPAAIAQAIGWLLDDPVLAQRLRREGLRRARLFSWERCANETRAVYARTLSRAGRR